MDTFYKYTVLLIAFFFCNLFYGQKTISKKIEKTYNLTNSGELHVDNKYGEILINGWDKSTIQIEATIKVTHKKADKATSLLNRIESKLTATTDFVKIETEIGKKNATAFSKYFNKVNPFDFDKGNVEINYTIYMPSNAEIAITNKFGDVIISDWNGKLKTTMQHGDLWINENLTNATINMKFGKLNAKSILYGDLTIKNGEINLDESRILELNSSGTTMKATKIRSLELYSNKDEIAIDELTEIKGQVKFSTINLKEVKDQINLTTKLADIKISNIISQNANIKLNQESSDIHINIADFAFQFNAKLEQGLLRIPTSFKNVKNNVIDKSKKIREINAYYGNKPSGNISIKGYKGVIILKE